MLDNTVTVIEVTLYNWINNNSLEMENLFYPLMIPFPDNHIPLYFHQRYSQTTKVTEVFVPNIRWRPEQAPSGGSS